METEKIVSGDHTKLHVRLLLGGRRLLRVIRDARILRVFQDPEIVVVQELVPSLSPRAKLATDALQECCRTIACEDGDRGVVAHHIHIGNMWQIESDARVC